MNKAKLKEMLGKATGCTLQHDGWTCGTCFFAIGEEGDLTNEDWQNVLAIRGDYDLKELTNLPKDREASYDKIIKLCEEKIR